MIVAIHQPNYIPWLGYLYKVRQSDVFVYLDDAQYTKNSFINRNRIKTPRGEQWLTIPVRTAGQLGSSIAAMTTDVGQRWTEKHLSTLLGNYRRAPHYEEVLAALRPVFAEVRANTTIAEFNIQVLQAIFGLLGIAPRTVRASELRIESESTERLIQIVQSLGGTEYLSGTGGMKYQDEQAFAAAGIRLRYSDFVSAEYPQLWGEFTGGLSVIDALMNLGRGALCLIEGVRQ